MEIGIDMRTPIRYKKVSGKKKPLCDYHGECNNIGYAEVYFPKTKKEDGSGWSYLCKKHFKQEKEAIDTPIMHWILPNKSQKFLKWGNLKD